MTLRYNAAMDGKYRLVFRGEVLDGQHRAVVRRRLAEALKLNDAQADKLFSGTAVVLKKEADAEQAARYQALFKKAGARLRVLALERAASKPAASETEPSPAPRAGSGTPASAVAKQRVQNTVSADKVASAASPSKLTVVAPQELEQRIAASRSEKVEISAPDFSVAAPGSTLGVEHSAPPPVVPDPDFSVAEVGVDLLDERAEVPQVDLGPLDFEVAEVGATMGDDSPKAAPAAPDTSHIRLVDDA